MVKHFLAILLLVITPPFQLREIGFLKVLLQVIGIPTSTSHLMMEE